MVCFNWNTVGINKYDLEDGQKNETTSCKFVVNLSNSKMSMDGIVFKHSHYDRHSH